MLYHEIQGTKVPALGFGTWQMEGTECYEAVADALKIGYRHLDTARMYNNEGEVGRAMEESGVARGEIFLTSKIWMDQLEHDSFVAETEKSLELLKTDYLDLVLIHWPNNDIPLEQPFRAMATLKERGLIRHGGLSNYPAPLMARAMEAGPVFCNQVEYHAFLGQDALLADCARHDILLTAYLPLHKGDVIEDPVMQEIARAHGKTAAQVALRWLIQQPKVAAIPKSAQADRRRENFDLFDFELSGEEMQRIQALPKDRRKADPPFAPDWDMAAA